MATYLELVGLGVDATLRSRINFACIVAAETIRGEPYNTFNHERRLAWAKAVFAGPATEADRMMWAVLAQNKALTTVQITGATDAAIQMVVDAAVNVFATG